ncbi:MAG: hypothetical protein ACK4E7_13820 [Permianibacter sp.]
MKTRSEWRTTAFDASRGNSRQRALEPAAMQPASLAWTGAGLALPLPDLWPLLLATIARRRTTIAAAARQTLSP